MAISFVGSATGITSATLPTHKVGDLIVAFAFTDGTTTIPTLGSGFTSITTRTGTSSACRVGFRRATVTNTASGTWTNATSVVFVIYRDVGSIGSSSVSSGTSTTVTFPAVNLTNQTGSSWIVGFVGSSSTNVAIETAPSGMVNRTSVSDATDEAAAHDTNSGSSTFTSRTATIGGTSGNWVSASIELIDGSATASVSSFELLAYNFIYPETSNWYPWYFGPRTVGYSGESNVLFDGISASSDFSEITAIGQTNATANVSGIQSSSSSFGNLNVTVSDSEIVNGLESVSLVGQLTGYGDAYTLSLGVQSSSDVGSVAISASASRLVSGIDINSANGDLITSGTANYVLDGLNVSSESSGVGYSAQASLSVNGLESLSEFDIVSAVVSDSEIVNGIEAVSLAGQLSVTCDASYSQDSIDSSFEFGGLNVTANCDSSIEGFESVCSHNGLTAYGDSSHELSGIESQFGLGELSVIASQSQNADVQLDGISIQSYVGNVNATSESPESMRSGGQIKRYSVDIAIDATIKIGSVVSTSKTGNVFAVGTISTSTSISGVQLESHIDSVNATGILSISDEELIVLLAA